MAAKLLIDIPTMNWAYTVLLDSQREYSFGTSRSNSFLLPPGSGSERHAILVWRNDWVLEDCGSEAGISVNRLPTSSCALKDQDIIKVGPCEAVYQNPEAAAGKQEQQFAHRVAETHQSALQNVVDRAHAGNVGLNELQTALGGRATEPDASTDAPAPSQRSADVRTSEDLVWVAQQLAAIMSSVLKNPAGRDETYGLMLQHLRDVIGADNGFVMIPDQSNMRWIIRAWVGDSDTWTQYERTHPLPLTVTNRAYRTMAVVSNAFGESVRSDDEPLNSVSLQQLNVSSYIAVPLLEGQQRRGVLYFDTRNKDRKFRTRDIKLLELVGDCILEIEDQRS